MVMTKAEKARVEDLETRLALRFTEPVCKDVPPPKDGGIYLGWSYNAYSNRVYKTCSSVIYHGDGWENTNAQQPIHQYSTEIRALQALRNAVELECAKRLRAIDLKIEAIIQTPF